MKPLGIISGTLLLQGKGIFADLREETVETDFGRATVFRNAGIVFIARHGTDSHRHILPHQINHQANLTALKTLGVREILGIHSTGALKRRLKPGLLVVPDDYILLGAGPTVVREKATHIVPVLSAEVRRKWLEAARDCALDCIDGGIYWQTAGPRLETRAEIAMISQFADLVGMTMASEAVIAQELEIPYASLCSVDNFAHGLEEKALTMEKVLWHARHNAEAILRILMRYIEREARTSERI
ncbi:MAG: MTAP family purine nucleoside phosphorylase [Deltaproteobacteria bacterium]|nr:MTAP family purine nucleoside phosphorylase [Deltaproteobacteria bacterium]